MLREMYYWMMFFLKKIGKTEILEFNSYLLICILINANILTIIILASHLLNFDLTQLKEESGIIGLSGAISLLLFNYFYLFKKRSNIILIFENMDNKRRVKGQILFWVYSTMSIFLFFYIGINLTQN